MTRQVDYDKKGYFLTPTPISVVCGPFPKSIHLLQIGADNATMQRRPRFDRRRKAGESGDEKYALYLASESIHSSANMLLQATAK